jgi:hypothetical protein
MIRIIAILSAACLAMAAAPVIAQTLTPSAAGSYRINAVQFSASPTSIFQTGSISGAALRGFLIYDVPAGPAFTSATLSLNARVVSNGPITINVYDVSTTPSTIANGTATPGTTFTDLGTGVVFGTAVATTSDETLTITLSPDAITAINAARGSSIAFGLHQPVATGSRTAFGSSSGSTPRDLILVSAQPAPVPTLSEWAMILFGLMLAGGAAFYIQRRQLIA